MSAFLKGKRRRKGEERGEDVAFPEDRERMRGVVMVVTQRLGATMACEREGGKTGLRLHQRVRRPLGQS